MSLSRKSGVGNAILCQRSSLENPVTLTLLLDLDNTLLGNEMGVFLPAYLRSLGDSLKPYVSPEALNPALLDATQAMLLNKSPDRTLQQVFEAAFYPRLDLPPDALEEPITSFYREEFPKLRQLTTFRPEGVKLVEEALERGYNLVLATNALFPRTAVLQRLEWAGLPVEKYPFQLIPSYEHFHFAKPNVAFFAELLGRLGWPDGQFLMVGDDPDNDINPAQKFGLATYQVSDHPPVDMSRFSRMHGSGRLIDLLSWIESTPPEDLFMKAELPESLIEIIRSTPAVMASFTDGLPPAAWVEEPQPGEWSVTEILCHLRDVDGEVNLPRMKKVLAEVNPFLPGIDTDQWAEARLYYCQDGKSALSDFTRFRIELVSLLEGLEPTDWDRSARHAILGPTHLSELVRIVAAHDRLHVHQVCNALGEITRVVGT
jgi:FMN phosphatase YigB (HAD superfamily)